MKAIYLDETVYTSQQIEAMQVAETQLLEVRSLLSRVSDSFQDVAGTLTNRPWLKVRVDHVVQDMRSMQDRVESTHKYLIDTVMQHTRNHKSD